MALGSSQKQYAVAIIEENVSLLSLNSTIIRQHGTEYRTSGNGGTVFPIQAEGRYREEASFSTLESAQSAAIDLCSRWTEALEEPECELDVISIFVCRCEESVPVLEQIPFEVLEMS